MFDPEHVPDWFQLRFTFCCQIIEGPEIAELAAPGRSRDQYRAQEQDRHERDMSPENGSPQDHHRNGQVQFPGHQEFLISCESQRKLTEKHDRKDRVPRILSKSLKRCCSKV